VQIYFRSMESMPIGLNAVGLGAYASCVSYADWLNAVGLGAYASCGFYADWLMPLGWYLCPYVSYARASCVFYVGTYTSGIFYADWLKCRWAGDLCLGYFLCRLA
jgi:hypothetical protein